MRLPRHTAGLLIALLVIGVTIVAIQRLVPQRASPATSKVAPARAIPTLESQQSIAAQQPAAKEPTGPAIPEVQGIHAWVNSEPLTIQGLRGKVVVVDFWTYTCVNCIRTLPYLKEWQAKYASRGLVIVGVHTPEFDFEKDLTNVRAAVQKLGVTWPVALDNDYATWRAYGNRYWPHKYLADHKGVLRYDHIGEGGYLETEQRIRKLLTEAGHDVSDIPLGSKESLAGLADSITRELYAGRASVLGGYLGNFPVSREGNTGLYIDPGVHKDGKLYFHGRWEENEEFMGVAGPGPDGTAYVLIRYHARGVNAVIQPKGSSGFNLVVELDGKLLPKEVAGDDVSFDSSGNSIVRVDTPRMYNLVRRSDSEAHELKLRSNSLDFHLYTFTFSPS